MGNGEIKKSTSSYGPAPYTLSLWESGFEKMDDD
jgi:hypothetical protein